MSDSDSDDDIALRDQDAHAIQVASRALTLWQSFPTREPRLIVLIEGPVLHHQGFNTAEASRTLHYGVVEADATVASEPLQTIREHAADRSNQRMPTTPLRIESATLVQCTFSTDRGPIPLPAWRIEAVHVIGPMWVLEAKALDRCWLRHMSPEGQQPGSHILQEARTRDGECELVVAFIGGSDNLFWYEGAVVESRTAVSVVPLARFVTRLPPGTAISAQGFMREITVKLESPLGGRVLVNHDGSPVEVLMNT